MSTETAPSPFAHLSNDELRQELTKNGIAYGPIMEGTRKVYERKLQNVLEGGNPTAENGNNKSLQNGSPKPKENGTSKNGPGMNGKNSSSVAARTPSRESTPLVEQRAQTPVNGTEGAQRETSPKPTAGVEEHSDHEEEGAETARVLTPEEVGKFRAGFRSHPDSPATNGSNVRLRRQHSAHDYYTNNGRAISPTVATNGGLSMLKRFVLPVLALLVVVGLAVVAFQMRDRLAVPTALHNCHWPNWVKSWMAGGNKDEGNVGGLGKGD